MHGSRGSMDPAQVRRSSQLLRPQRDREENFYLAQVLFNAIVAVALCDLQEMSYEEAATIVGCAVGTVRSRLHRARTLLAAKLSELRTPQSRLVAGGCEKS